MPADPLARFEFTRSFVFWPRAIQGKPKTFGGCRLERPKAAQMLQMFSFGIILDHFGPKAAHMLHMVSFGAILDHFGPKATQMLQMVSFGIVLDDFGPMA